MYGWNGLRWVRLGVPLPPPLPVPAKGWGKLQPRPAVKKKRKKFPRHRQNAKGETPSRHAFRVGCLSWDARGIYIYMVPFLIIHK